MISKRASKALETAMGDAKDAAEVLARINLPNQSSRIEHVTITLNMLVAGGCALNHTPAFDESVMVLMPAGCAQIHGLDFVMSGNYVDWQGWGMEPLLEVNDQIVVTYLTEQ